MPRLHGRTLYISNQALLTIIRHQSLGIHGFKYTLIGSIQTFKPVPCKFILVWLYLTLWSTITENIPQMSQWSPSMMSLFSILRTLTSYIEPSRSYVHLYNLWSNSFTLQAHPLTYCQAKTMSRTNVHSPFPRKVMRHCLRCSLIVEVQSLLMRAIPMTLAKIELIHIVSSWYNENSFQLVQQRQTLQWGSNPNIFTAFSIRMMLFASSLLFMS